MRTTLNGVVPSGVGTVPVGKIVTGVLKPGMVLSFSPARLTGEVKSIEMHHQGLQTALPGHNVGFNIRNVSSKNLRRGDVAGNAQQDPPSEVNSFVSQVNTAVQSQVRGVKLAVYPLKCLFYFIVGNHSEPPW